MRSGNSGALAASGAAGAGAGSDGFGGRRYLFRDRMALMGGRGALSGREPRGIGAVGLGGAELRAGVPDACRFRQSAPGLWRGQSVGVREAGSPVLKAGPNAGGRAMNPALAPSYVAVTERPGQPASRIQLEMLAARYRWAAEQARGKDVLEAGCGAGMGLPVLAEVALSVQAGDVDAENLRMARRACAGHTSIGLRAFRAQELPFPGDSFD